MNFGIIKAQRAITFLNNSLATICALFNLIGKFSKLTELMDVIECIVLWVNFSLPVMVIEAKEPIKVADSFLFILPDVPY